MTRFPTRHPAPLLLLLGLLVGCAPADNRTATAGPSLTWRFTESALSCDEDGHVYLSGVEQFPETAQILVTASDHFGETWSPRFEYVNRSDRGDRGRPQLASGGQGLVYVLWEDTRDGPLQVYLNRSRDGGRTWLADDRRVNALESRGRGLSAPRMVVDQERVCVVWLDDREGFDAFYANCSEDAGETWLAQDVRVTDIDLGNKSIPRLVSDGRGGIYLAWVELQSGRQQVRFSASQDHGRTWAIQPQTLSAPGNEANLILPVDLAILENGTLVVAWTQYRAGIASTWVARSENRALSWNLPETLQGRVSDPFFNPSAPRVLAEGFGTVHVAWQSLTENRVPILLVQTSKDGGRTFTERRIRRPAQLEGAFVDYRTTTHYVPPFSMASDGNGTLYFAWVDLELARTRVGFRRLNTLDMTPGVGPLADFDLAGNLPATTEPPALCADTQGHVYLLWNEARSLTFATSPFQGDTGWRFQRF